jgi:hypothetical protein
VGICDFVELGKTPADRVKTLLGKLDSVRGSQERGSKVSTQSKALFHKFMEQVEHIFKNLPKPLEWRSFYNNDLPLLIDFCEEVRDAYLEHHLNKLKLPAASFGECARFCGMRSLLRFKSYISD